MVTPIVGDVGTSEDVESVTLESVLNGKSVVGTISSPHPSCSREEIVIDANNVNLRPQVFIAVWFVLRFTD